MKRVYVSGPMTGIHDNNYPEFFRVADLLRKDGFDVVNPAELVLDCEPTWENFMKRDIGELVTCDSICMLRGWETSKGAHFELEIAFRLGMKVFFEESFYGR